MAELPVWLVFVVGAGLVALLPRRLASVVWLAIPVVAFAHLLALEPGTIVTTSFYGYELVPVRVDRLSLAFGYVFVLAAFLGSLYGLRLMGTGERVVATLYAGSALGVVFAGDLLSLFVLWEIKAVASTILIWARRTPGSASAGMRYLFVHLAGGTTLLAGILWHLSVTGSLAFDLFDPAPASYLVLIGFALSAAVPPLHAWLPDAYPEASVAGMVFLSAFTTKAAVYTLLRGFAGYELLIWVGVAMALYGVVYAVLENDIRRLLGYHIISQVGYMVAAAGVGTELAVNGATAHAFAHILYKGLLLMGAGAVLYATGRSKLTELGGIAHLMPVVVVLYMVGAFSISGFPLFSGFVSKELAVESAGAAGYELVVHLLKLASVGTFLHTGLKLPYFTWFGPRRQLQAAALPSTMLVAMALTAGINVAIGLAPGLLYALLPYPVEFAPYTLSHVVETSQLLLFTALGFWLLVSKLGGEPTITLDTDWFYRSAPALVAPAVTATVELARWPSAVERLRRTPLVARVSQGLSFGGDDAVGSVPARAPARPWPTSVLGVTVVGAFVVLLAMSLLS